MTDDATGSSATVTGMVPALAMTKLRAKLVRSWRRRALLTQEQLALRAGLGVRTIRRLESGSATRPRDCSVSLLADALNLPSEDRAQFLAVLRA
jgi:transcriptional regulator with XRE-family HTH domain